MGTATVYGRLWGARATDWADCQEAAVRPCYEHALAELAPVAGTNLLDVGCGSGVFASLAWRNGAVVTGIDAAERMLAIAKGRVPDAEFQVAEMEELPYADDSFDIATGFNSFQYAADPIHAMAEAARVVRPGGRVLRMTWGRADQVEAVAYTAALGSLLPPPPPGTPGPHGLAEPGALEDILAKAGLEPGERHEVACPWVYPDEETAMRGLMSSGPAARAIEHSGLDAVIATVAGALRPFRQDDGSYVMHNTFHYVIATVPGE
jgi:SAM-dependent methyltransferase